MAELDFTERYRVKSWNLAVAVRPIEYKEECDETWEFIGNEDDDREDQDNWAFDYHYYQDKNWIYVIMVGDDTRHLVETDDLELLTDEDYCSECGQIGCTADGR